MSIQRYAMSVYQDFRGIFSVIPKEDKNGDWVLYKDHLKEIEKLKELQKAKLPKYTFSTEWQEVLTLDRDFL